MSNHRAARNPTSSRWTLTMNKPDDVSDDDFIRGNEAVEKIKALCESGEVAYFCMQYERGQESQRLHGQGFLVLMKPHNKTWLSNRLSGRTNFTPRKAMEIDDQNGHNYCNNPDKEGFVRLGYEFGSFPDSIPRSEVQAKKPSQRDLVAAMVNDGHSYDEIQARFPGFALMYERLLKRAIDKNAAVENRIQYKKRRTEYVPKVWQHWLWQYLECVDPDDRIILQISDKAGNSGKNRFIQEFKGAHKEGEVQHLNAGKEADLNLAFRPTVRVLFLNITRCKADHVSHIWAFCENIKDGAIFTSKYESEMREFAPPHVVIFTNDEVDIGKKGGYYPGRLTSTGEVVAECFSVSGRPKTDLEHFRLDHTTDENVWVPNGADAPFTYDRYLWWDLNDKLRETFDPIHDPFFPAFNALNKDYERITVIPPMFGPAYSGDNAGDGPGAKTVAATRNTSWPIPNDRYRCHNGYGFWWCMKRGKYISPDVESGTEIHVYWKYSENVYAPWIRFSIWYEYDTAKAKYLSKSKRLDNDGLAHPDWTPHFPPTFYEALDKIKSRTRSAQAEEDTERIFRD